jgi:arylsulfatase
MLQAARALFACALLAACGAPTASDQAPRPDVVLVTIDTLRADALGSYGAPAGASPRIDAFARESVLFERALAASASTAPSHASIFTSRNPRGHSVGHHNGSTRLEGSPTLATLLDDAGYDTAAFVSNMMLRDEVGFSRGFDVYDDELPESERNRLVFERGAERTAKRAVAWLEQRREKPFFLWVHFNEPHGPYTPPRELIPAASAAPGEQPLPVVPRQLGYQGIPEYQAIGDERLPSQYRARYAGEVRVADEWFGTLLDALDATPRGRAAIVVLTADHGESMGAEEIWFGHGHAGTPNLAHVPLILRAPGLSPARVPSPVHHIDIAPSVLDLAGLPHIPLQAGLALGAYVRDGRPIPQRTLFVEARSEVAAYRGDRFLRQVTDEALGNPAGWEPRAFRWDSDTEWSRTDAMPGIESGLRFYLTGRVPLAFSKEELNDEQRAQLQALGYLDPEG